MRRLSSLTVPELADGAVVLRRPEVADAATVLAGTRDPLVREFMQGVIPHQDLDAAGRRLADIPARLWAMDRAAYSTVVSVTDGRAVGWAELVDLRPEEGAAEAAVWLLPAARSLRTAASALRLLCRFGFDQLELGRTDAYAAADNMPVQIVGACIGFPAPDSGPGCSAARGRRRCTMPYTRRWYPRTCADVPSDMRESSARHARRRGGPSRGRDPDVVGSCFAAHGGGARGRFGSAAVHRARRGPGGRIGLAVEATGEFRVERASAGGHAFRSGRVDRIFLTRVLKALSSSAPGNAQVAAGADARLDTRASHVRHRNAVRRRCRLG
ncbi:GNAT family N-acetyltransferase [Kitasatospora sp. KL5]|uniref:GNAT family N-acetyltransferase n=1 Tax=Kitasatospora sp. KL5 TaxID=3425125 RepID=UPI003D6E2E89